MLVAIYRNMTTLIQSLRAIIRPMTTSLTFPPLQSIFSCRGKYFTACHGKQSINTPQTTKIYTISDIPLPRSKPYKPLVRLYQSIRLSYLFWLFCSTRQKKKRDNTELVPVAKLKYLFRINFLYKCPLQGGSKAIQRARHVITLRKC